LTVLNFKTRGCYAFAYAITYHFSTTYVQCKDFLILLGADRTVVGPMQSIPIATNVVSVESRSGEVYSKQHYVIKFVSGLQ